MENNKRERQKRIKTNTLSEQNVAEYARWYGKQTPLANDRSSWCGFRNHPLHNPNLENDERVIGQLNQSDLFCKLFAKLILKILLLLEIKIYTSLG